MQISLADAAHIALDSIEHPARWQTLVIDRRMPITHRAWIMHGDTRICLHRFEPCRREEAFLHPHPWPSTMLVLDGVYDMHVGYAADPASEQPDEVISLQLASGSTYDMSVPGAWHQVVPQTRCYSLMINGPAWDTGSRFAPTTQGKDRSRMNSSQLNEHLAVFEKLLTAWIQDSRHTP